MHFTRSGEIERGSFRRIERYYPGMKDEVTLSALELLLQDKSALGSTAGLGRLPSIISRHAYSLLTIEEPESS
jgi:hypothetical protein